MSKPGHRAGKKIRPDWRDRIQVGDVLETPSGDLRVVRQVKMRGGGCELVGWVTFAIRRCSWTTRSYTVVDRSELRTRGFKPTGRRVRLRSSLDKRIAHDIKFYHPECQTTTCCDVAAAP